MSHVRTSTMASDPTETMRLGALPDHEAVGPQHRVAGHDQLAAFDAIAVAGLPVVVVERFDGSILVAVGAKVSRRAERVSPDGVVGRVDEAVLVVVAAEEVVFAFPADHQFVDADHFERAGVHRQAAEVGVPELVLFRRRANAQAADLDEVGGGSRAEAVVDRVDVDQIGARRVLRRPVIGQGEIAAGAAVEVYEYGAALVNECGKAQKRSRPPQRARMARTRVFIV